jgi:hypothetical protein
MSHQITPIPSTVPLHPSIIDSPMNKMHTYTLNKRLTASDFTSNVSPTMPDLENIDGIAPQQRCHDQTVPEAQGVEGAREGLT